MVIIHMREEYQNKRLGRYVITQFGQINILKNQNV